MASKINIPYYSITNTIYITVRDENGLVWNGTTFKTWVDENIATYVINAMYKNGSVYSVQFPVGIANGYYTAMIFLQSGGSPNAAVDIWIGSLAAYWNKDNMDLLPVRGDSLIEYSDGQRFTEKAVEAAGGDGVTIIERTPKVQVEAEEGVDTVTVPAEVEVLPAGVQRESSAEISGNTIRKSSTRVGP